jgi:beta-lactam-binding protein with PASTA domain
VSLAAVILLAAGCDAEIGAGDDRMPALVGKSAEEANAALDARGFTPSYGSAVPVDEKRCRVVFQKAPPGSRVEPYSTQAVRCVVRVPRVVGQTADDAELRLGRLGLDVDFPGGPSVTRRGGCRVVDQGRLREARPQTDIPLTLRC